jgi:hypothetical protein
MPIIAVDEQSGSSPLAVESSPVWMTAAEAIQWVARGEPRFFDGFPGLDVAPPPEFNAEDLVHACEAVARAGRDELLTVFGHRTINGRPDPAAVAAKLESLIFLGGRIIGVDGCVRQIAFPGAASDTEFDRVHFRRAEVLSLWPERLPPDVVRAGEPLWITNARKRAEVRGRHARRFAEKQRLTRQWVNFAAVADWCARERGSIEPDEKLRAVAYEQLRLALASGAFTVGEKSSVLFFGDVVSWARMTRERLAQIESCFDPEFVYHGFLRACWVPHEFAGRWFDERNLPRPHHLFPPVTASSATGRRVSVATDAPTEPTTSAKDDRVVRRRKASPGLNYEASDAPLVLEMRNMIVSGQAKTPWEAAQAVSTNAQGSPQGTSKAQRLHRRYSVAFSAERD